MQGDPKTSSAPDLSVEPISTGPWTRRAIVFAFLAPSVAAGAPCVVRMLGKDTVGPAEGLTLFAALVWAGALLKKSWRGMLVDVGRIVLARVGFLPFVALALLALLVASSEHGGALEACLAAWTAAMCVAAALHAGPRMKRHLALLAFYAVLLLGADVFVRHVVLPGKSQNEISIEHDPDLGWKLRPGVAVLHKTKDYTSYESVSSIGFRTKDRPFEKPAGVKRVVLLGDSHVEGYVVNDGETWAVKLEELIAQDGPVEVIALGVGGWSTDQELLCWLKYGRQFHPDVVVLQTCSNDPPFNVLDHYWRGRKPLFVRHGDQLFLSGVPVPNLRNTGLLTSDVLKKSALAVLLESMARQVAIDREAAAAEEESPECWLVTDLLIRDLARLVHEDGAAFAVLDANTRDPHKPEFDSKLRACLAKRSIRYLETDAAYVDDFKSYWTGGHWNAKGQAAVAAVLAPQVRAMLDTPRGETSR